MAKFGDLISKEKTLILFYDDWDQDYRDAELMVTDIAKEFGESLQVIKIDFDKNKELCDALSIRKLPTFMIYKSGQRFFKASGEISKEQLIEELQN